MTGLVGGNQPTENDAVDINLIGGIDVTVASAENVIKVLKLLAPKHKSFSSHQHLDRLITVLMNEDRRSAQDDRVNFIENLQPEDISESFITKHGCDLISLSVTGNDLDIIPLILPVLPNAETVTSTLKFLIPRYRSFLFYKDVDNLITFLLNENQLSAQDDRAGFIENLQLKDIPESLTKDPAYSDFIRICSNFYDERHEPEGVNRGTVGASKDAQAVLDINYTVGGIDRPKNTRDNVGRILIHVYTRLTPFQGLLRFPASFGAKEGNKDFYNFIDFLSLSYEVNSPLEPEKVIIAISRKCDVVEITRKMSDEDYDSFVSSAQAFLKLIDGAQPALVEPEIYEKLPQ